MRPRTPLSLATCFFVFVLVFAFVLVFVFVFVIFGGNDAASCVLVLPLSVATCFICIRICRHNFLFLSKGRCFICTYMNVVA